MGGLAKLFMNTRRTSRTCETLAEIFNLGGDKMDKNMRFIIKPVIIKKRVGIFALVLLMFAIGAAFDGGSFDIGMFIFQVLMLSMLLYLYLKFLFRPIIVEEEKFIYKGLTKKVKIKYSDIENLIVLSNESKEGTNYSLIVSVVDLNKVWQISNIENYRKREIENLIEIIKSRTTLNNDNLKHDLFNVNWRHD